MMWELEKWAEGGVLAKVEERQEGQEDREEFVVGRSDVRKESRADFRGDCNMRS
jgi:hypothetical protein